MPETSEMLLKGGKDVTTKGLDGKTVIRAKVYPLVVERAKEYVAALEKAEDYRDKANEFGQALQQVFKKMDRQCIAKVITDRRTYVIRPGVVEKLIVEKTQTVK